MSGHQVDRHGRFVHLLVLLDKEFQHLEIAAGRGNMEFILAHRVAFESCPAFNEEGSDFNVSARYCDMDWEYSISSVFVVSGKNHAPVVELLIPYSSQPPSNTSTNSGLG